MTALGLLTFGAWSASAIQPKDEERVRACVEGLAAGRGSRAAFSVTYNDQHALHGGLIMTIFGDGRVEQQALRMEVREPKQVSRGDLDRLAALVRELRAWEQRTPTRDAIPDESRSRLTVRCGGVETTIWEWYNDMKANARIIRVRDLMTAIAWPPA
jgi:hypothetical protein